MKHKFRILLICACVLSILQSSVYGAVINFCDYDRDTKVAIVSGTTKRANSKDVTISVRNGDTVYYEGQTTADDGAFSFTFTLVGDAPVNYNVLVGEYAVLQAAKDTLEYYGKSTVLGQLNKYAEEGKNAEFNTLLEGSLKELGITLTETEKGMLDAINDKIVANAPFAKVSDLQTCVVDEIYLYTLITAKDGAQVQEILKNNTHRIEAKYPETLKLYNASTNQVDICTNIKADIDETITIEKVNEIFLVNAAGYLIKNAGGWGAAKTVISTLKSEIGITAETLSSVSGVYTDMMNDTYEVYTDFDTNYKDAVKNNPPSGDEDEDDDPPGGGGGGGGSSINPPPVVDNPQTGTPSMPGASEGSEMFTDIASVEWAKTAIETLAKDGVINGKADGIFAPNDNILREEVVAMMVRLLDLPDSDNKTGFADIKSGAWCEDYCYAVRDAGLVNGIDDVNFGIGMNITRQDLITIIYRTIQKNNYNPTVNEDTEPFADNDAFADYAVEAAQYLKSCGIIDGRDGGKFYPNANITRAEAAKVLYALRNLKIESDYVVTGGAK